MDFISKFAEFPVRENGGTDLSSTFGRESIGQIKAAGGESAAAFSQGFRGGVILATLIRQLTS